MCGSCLDRTQPKLTSYTLLDKSDYLPISARAVFSLQTHTVKQGRSRAWSYLQRNSARLRTPRLTETHTQLFIGESGAIHLLLFLASDLAGRNLANSCPIARRVQRGAYTS